MRTKLVSLLLCSFVFYFQANAQKCDKAIDVVYVLDGSGSVTAPNFQKVLTAIHNVVQDFSIGTSDSDTHVGFVTFNESAFLNFGLGTYTDESSLLTAIGNVPYPGGNTNIASGMNLALSQVFGQNGDRSNVPDVMVVITDGQDNSSVAAAQALAKSRGITIWAVGVGSGFDYNQLVAVAGTASNVKNVTDFDFLEQALDTIPCPGPCEQCLDLHYECAAWAKLGYCVASSTNPPSEVLRLQEKCPVSCGVCKETCVDVGCNCEQRAAAGECFKDPEYMLVKCKKSCNYCDRCMNLWDGCYYFSTFPSDLCNNPVNATDMHFYCRHSCGDCTPKFNCSQGLDPVAHKCPRDWAYSASDNACYWATPKPLSVANSRISCQQKGGDLASIHSNETNNFLTYSYYPVDMPYVETIRLVSYPHGVTGWTFQHSIGLVPPGYTTWYDLSTRNYTNWANPSQPAAGGDATVLCTYDSATVGWPRSKWFTTPPGWGVAAFCEKPVCVSSPTTTTTTTMAAPVGK